VALGSSRRRTAYARRSRLAPSGARALGGPDGPRCQQRERSEPSARPKGAESDLRADPDPEKRREPK